MRILVITPARAGSRHGNRVTALRWAGILRELGHQVRIETAYVGLSAEVLIALHARKSYSSIAGFRRDYPARPVVLALTGTDVYHDLRQSARAKRALELADRLIALQPLAAAELPRHVRPKARVIYQSCEITPGRPRPLAEGAFTVCVVGHLRPVKDPFRTALAARSLPAESRIRILHFGKAMTEAMAGHARREELRNRRYRWLGDRARSTVLERLRGSQLLVVSSKLEGGANVLSEALAVGTPVLASRVSGNVGILGSDYPGYFDAGETEQLAELLWAVETDRAFFRSLSAACRKRRGLFTRTREKSTWKAVLRELGVD